MAGPLDLQIVGPQVADAAMQKFALLGFHNIVIEKKKKTAKTNGEGSNKF